MTLSEKISKSLQKVLLQGFNELRNLARSFFTNATGFCPSIREVNLKQTFHKSDQAKKHDAANQQPHTQLHELFKVLTNLALRNRIVQSIYLLKNPSLQFGILFLFRNHFRIRNLSHFALLSCQINWRSVMEIHHIIKYR